MKIDNNKLIFSVAKYPDEAGVYQCVAENLHGMIVSSTWVKVLGKYSIYTAGMLNQLITPTGVSCLSCYRAGINFSYLK